MLTHLLPLFFLAQAGLPQSAPVYWKSTISAFPDFQLHRVDSRLSVFLGNNLVGVLDATPDTANSFSGSITFPQTSNCAPNGIATRILLLDKSTAEVHITAPEECPLVAAQGAKPVSLFRLQTFPPQTGVSNPGQIWLSDTFGQTAFRFKIDAEQVSIFRESEVVAYLPLVKSRSSSSKKTYKGKTSLPPASGCPGGQGRMVVTEISPNLIRAYIEKPSRLEKSGEILCAGIIWDSFRLLGPQVLFFPQPELP